MRYFSLPTLRGRAAQRPAHSRCCEAAYLRAGTRRSKARADWPWAGLGAFTIAG